MNFISCESYEFTLASILVNENLSSKVKSKFFLVKENNWCFLCLFLVLFHFLFVFCFAAHFFKKENNYNYLDITVM